jgi:cytochrome b6-f complex iron-sulfur subunit
MSPSDRDTTDPPHSPLAVTRRGMLAIGAVGLSAGALAACTQAPTGTGTGGGPAAGSSPGGPLAKLSDIKVGEAISATGPDGAKIIIARPTQSTVAAFSAICTHQACLVRPAGRELDCPCHGSVYNATTGEVIIGPAPRALAKVDVAISGDNVVAG